MARPESGGWTIEWELMLHERIGKVDSTSKSADQVTIF